MAFEESTRKEPTGPSTHRGLGQIPGLSHAGGRNGLYVTETASTTGNRTSEQRGPKDTSKAFTMNHSSSSFWTPLQSPKRLSSDHSNETFKRVRTTNTAPSNGQEPNLSEQPVGHNQDQRNEFGRQCQANVGGIREGSSTTLMDGGQASPIDIDNNQAEASVSAQGAHPVPASHTIGTGGPEASSSSSVVPAAAAPVVNTASTPTEAARRPDRPIIHFDIIEALQPIEARIRWSTSGSFSDKTVDTVFRDVARLTKRDEAQVIEFELTTSVERPRYPISRGDQDDFKTMCQEFSQAIGLDLKRPKGKSKFILRLIPDFAMNSVSEDIRDEEEEQEDTEFRL